NIVFEEDMNAVSRRATFDLRSFELFNKTFIKKRPARHGGYVFYYVVFCAARSLYQAPATVPLPFFTLLYS
ncbi:MAG: hypothetical protein OSJ68_10370, partial [Clostridia bacterium]|nr:hypothetical protein [Clostridia bacterium]